MIGRSIRNFLKWAFALALLGGLFIAAYWVNQTMQAERLREGGDQVQSPRRARLGVVEVGVEDAKRIALEEAPARSVSWSERVPIYGEVVPNPKATVEMRSPFAGTLRAEPDTAWPAPGQWIRSGQPLGWVDIRVGPQERLSLQDNLNNARLKKEGAEKVVQLQQERVNRLDKMSRSQIVPGQQLDDAKVLLAEAETQLAIARAAVELWQRALEEADRPGGRELSVYSQPLRAPAEGEVTELAARPGTVVEAGSLVAQLVDFRRVLVRMKIPPEFATSGLPPHLQLFAIPPAAAALGGVLDSAQPIETTRRLEATLLGPAPQVDEASQFVGFWYHIEPDPTQGTAEEGGPSSGGPGALWRPGLHVKALVTPTSARVQQAVAIPADAVLFHQGRSLVYVRVKPGAYERREVRLLGREDHSWVVAPHEGLTGLDAGDSVVSRGAQMLLSEEYRSDVSAD